MNTINNKTDYIKNLLIESKRKHVQAGELSTPGKKNDSANISDTSKAMKKIDDFLNLGKTDRFDLSDLNSGEKEEFYKMVAKLMEKGIVGYEVLEVNGKPEKHFIVNEIGDKRIYGSKLYRKRYE